MKDELRIRTALTQRHAQGRDGQWSIQAGTHGPANNAPAEDVQDRDQIQPALASDHPRRIADPGLIATRYPQIGQTIRSNRSPMATIRRCHPILGTAPGKEPFCAHEPGDAVALPRTTQGMGQSWAAISLSAARELLLDASAQARVLERARARLCPPLPPVVVTAARDQQRFTQPSYLVGAAHLLDPGIPLGGTSERMPRDFFKTSRCSKSLEFSARKRRISASNSSMLRFGLCSRSSPSSWRSSRAQR